MERKIGEIFECGGEWYQCVEWIGPCCEHCDLKFNECNEKCDCDEREDGKNIIFKKLEKVGEPFSCGYYGGTELIMMQEYKVQEIRVVHTGKVPIYVTDEKHKRVAIAIKQKQEDMEEKELTYEELRHYYDTTVGLWAIDRSPQEVDLKWIVENAFQLDIDTKHSNSESIGKNLRPFSLEAAKSGKPVCTRGGRKARIICFDAKGTHPIIALVSDPDIEGAEIPFCYTNDGFYNNPNCESTHDLMILPEKKEGWVNVYRDFNIVHAKNIFDTREEALKNIDGGENCVATVKIEWEE